MCTLYQIMYKLTSFREWSVPDSGPLQTIKGRDMLLVWGGGDHYTQTQTKDKDVYSSSIKSKMINIDNCFKIWYV